MPFTPTDLTNSVERDQYQFPEAPCSQTKGMATWQKNQVVMLFPAINFRCQIFFICPLVPPLPFLQIESKGLQMILLAFWAISPSSESVQTLLFQEQRRELRGRQWPAEIIPLETVAAALAQKT